MPKSAGLSLSKHQREILPLLEIDAWYLNPPSRRVKVSEKESQALEQTFKALSARLAAPSLPASDAPQPSTVSAPSSMSSASGLSSVDLLTTNKLAHLSENAPPQPVTLARTLDTQVPDSCQLAMPYEDKPFVSDWSALAEALKALPRQPQLPVFSGVGNKTAQWFFILPPPGRRAIKEKQLLDAASLTLFTSLLAAINRTLDQVYFTPLTKQGNPYGLEPATDILVEQIPLLTSEILLVKPKKIFVMGQVAASQLLQTHALLGELMNQTYQLALGDGDNQHQAKLICLPDFDYYLALPSEKAKLWQCLKQLS